MSTLPHTIHTDARFTLDEMRRRLSAWAKKPGADQQLIGQRTDELRILYELLHSAVDNRIVLVEQEPTAYRRGFEAARRKLGPSKHGIVDRRVIQYDSFGSPYNPENERRRREHNLRQRKRWADHY